MQRLYDRYRAGKPALHDQPVPAGLQMPDSLGDVFETTVPLLRHAMDTGGFSSKDFVDFCRDYIRLLNPHLGAVIEVNPDADIIATRLDEQRRQAGTPMTSLLHPATKPRSEEVGGLPAIGPLHGIPVLVKDNMATKDGIATTAGSLALLGSVVREDAFIVKKLRRAGAVILGHANMCEWASLRSKEESVGYSPRGGQTRNPFDLRKDPFGSSSGSAVAVSANLVPIAYGTETDTSIIGPADYNGVVGIKPTVGMTSRTGVIPISRNLDTVGPFARTVGDAAIALDAIAGPDEEDPFTTVPERRQPPSFAALVSDQAALRGARFGLPMKRCWDLVAPGRNRVASEVLELIKGAGAEILEVDLPSIEERVGPEGNWDWERGEPSKSEYTVCSIDAYNDINAYLRGLEESPVRSLEEVVEYNIKHTDKEGGLPGTHPCFPGGQENFLRIVESKGVEDETYHAALRHIRSQCRENGIDAALKHPEDGSPLDALLFCDRKGVGQQYAAQAGYPIMCIPIGLDENGMPVSLSLQQTAWKDDELVRWASAIEDLLLQTKGWRATPTLRNWTARNLPIEKVE